MPSGGTAALRRALRQAAVSYGPSPAESDAIRRYQTDEDTHEGLNSLLRGRDARPAEVRRLRPVLRGLDSILARAALPVPVTVYKGVRDRRDVLAPGVELPASVAQHAYLSTSLDRAIAVRDFLGDSPDAALLEIRAGAGVPALWLPPLGDRDYAYESEVLFRRGTLLTLYDQRADGGTLVLSCEVVW